MKKFFYSGLLTRNRKRMDKLIALAATKGYEKVSKVNKQTELFVEGNLVTGERHDEAVRYGIPMIHEDDFRASLLFIPCEQFWAGIPAADSEPGALIHYFSEIDWQKFVPADHGEMLRNYLLQHESKFGITTVHRFVSEKIFSSTPHNEKLQLMHPFGHHETWSYHAISRDGRWLAIANELDMDHYEEGSNLQIWEVETGRIVNSVWIEGGIGWGDGYKSMEWSPDSNEIALAYNTNAIGVWNPFGNRADIGSLADPKTFASVTDGQTFPPYFEWYRDGKSIFIQCPFFNDFDRSVFVGDAAKEQAYYEDKNNGCRVVTDERRGNISESAVFARSPTVFDEEGMQMWVRTAGIQEDTTEYKGVNGSRIVVTQKSVTFYRANGEEYGSFTDYKPTTEHPLIIDGVDTKLDYGTDPAFGICINGEVKWGIKFNYTYNTFRKPVVVAANGFDKNILSWSLGRKWHWKTEWFEFKQVETLQEYFDAVKNFRYRES